MEWEGNRDSSNVKDRRGSSGGLLGGRSVGIGPITILNVLSGGGAPTAQVAQQSPAKEPPADDGMGKFVPTVLAETEDVWKDLFAKGGATYKKPHLVLFKGQTSTGGCGGAKLQWVRFIAWPTRRFTSIWRFMKP